MTRCRSTRRPRSGRILRAVAASLAVWACFAVSLSAQVERGPASSEQAPAIGARVVAVVAETLYTMEGPPIRNGVVLFGDDGKIREVGVGLAVPEEDGDGVVVRCKVATPGLIDGRSVAGLAGYLNQDQDQDQLDPTEPAQPELRAIDSYDTREPLVAWLRTFGVTTLHTGHAPAALIPGQTFLVKTWGNTVEDAMLRRTASVAVTLGRAGTKRGGKPGNRSKQIAMLRGMLLEARAYADKDDPQPDLRMQAMADVLSGAVPLVVHAHEAQDIKNALRLREEFGFRMILDGAAEAYLVLEEVKAAGIPVIAHPPMARHRGALANATFQLGKRLADAGVTFTYQSGYESYVPKTRVVLFEAAMGAAHGLGFDRALRAITIDAARILEIDERLGSLKAGKDGDVACYDGDPFEYTTHCVATVIDGGLVFQGAR